jgi:hypothetical protein
VDLEAVTDFQLLGYGWIELVLIAVAGVLSGVVNTLAGGGSLITLPALIFMGLPATVANGTNRVGVLVGAATAVTGFHSEKMLDWRRATKLLVPSSVGAVLGAWLSVDVDERLFQIVVGVAMLVAVTAVLVSPKRWLAKREERKSGRMGRTVEIASFVAIGFYGGFVQAGVGIFLLSGLVLVSDLDLVRANAIKMVLVFGYTILALAVFVYHDLVAWVPALALAVGSSAGGWLGSKMTATWGPPLVKGVLVVLVVVSVTRLFGLW